MLLRLAQSAWHHPRLVGVPSPEQSIAVPWFVGVPPLWQACFPSRSDIAAIVPAILVTWQFESRIVGLIEPVLPIAFPFVVAAVVVAVAVVFAAVEFVAVVVVLARPAVVRPGTTTTKRTRILASAGWSEATVSMHLLVASRLVLVAVVGEAIDDTRFGVTSIDLASSAIVALIEHFRLAAIATKIYNRDAAPKTATKVLYQDEGGSMPRLFLSGCGTMTATNAWMASQIR